jgi:hypothetical protein
LSIMLLLPTINHSLEFLFHRAGNTKNLTAGMIASICFSMISAAFNLHAMREGALIIGEGRQSLRRDLQNMPRLLLRFILLFPGIIFSKR